ncbi:MAG: hypothetical protein ACYS9X_11860 [Planctomycetota bacterium]
MSYEVTMACGPDGCKHAVVFLRDDAPWEIRREADGAVLACQTKPPQMMPGTSGAVEKFCLRIPAGLLQKLWEEIGPHHTG